MARLLTAFEQAAVLDVVLSGEAVAYAARQCGVGASDVWYTKRHDPGFAKQLADAREDSYEAMLDRAQDLTLSMLHQRPLNSGAPGTPAAVLHDAQMARAAIDGALRIATKLNPERFGERINHQHALRFDMGAVLAAADRRLAAHEAARLGHVIDVTPGSEEERGPSSFPGGTGGAGG